MDPKKVKVIDEWPMPKNLHKVRSFIGIYSYYRRFISSFSSIASPLHDLTKKKAKFQWTLKEHTAFLTLKQRVMSQPFLKGPNLKKTFEVHCDVFGDNVGAVLSQGGQSIAYESHCFHSKERSLGIYEKKLIFVIHALDSWKHYLLGTPFIIRIDRQNVHYFVTQTKLPDKRMRWANFLQQFCFHIAHNFCTYLKSSFLSSEPPQCREDTLFLTNRRKQSFGQLMHSQILWILEELLPIKLLWLPSSSFPPLSLYFV